VYVKTCGGEVTPNFDTGDCTLCHILKTANDVLQLYIQNFKVIAEIFFAVLCKKNCWWWM
jgi:hypothetical protein